MNDEAASDEAGRAHTGPEPVAREVPEPALEALEVPEPAPEAPPARGGRRGFAPMVSCSACGAELDSLRAGHVAIFAARVHYFCDYEGCRARFVAESRLAADPCSSDVRERALGPVLGVRAAPADLGNETTRDGAEHDVLGSGAPGELFEPIVDRVLVDAPRAVDGSARGELGLLLGAASLVAGVLAMALEFAPASRLVAVSRAALVLVGATALVGKLYGSESDPSRPRRWALVLGPCLAAGLALTGAMASDLRAGAAAIFVSATLIAVLAAEAWLFATASLASEAERHRMREVLDGGLLGMSWITPRNRPPSARAAQGDLVTVERDEVVPVDVELLEGEVEVRPWPWPDTAHPVRRRAGDVVVAGTRVVAPELRGRVLAVGDDRAFARATIAAAGRPDVHSEVAVLARGLAERGAPALGVLAGVLHAVTAHDALASAAVACAVYASMANVGVGGLAALAVAAGVREATNRGISYASGAAWDRSAKATVALFCARGTLVRGEPDLVEVVVLPRGADGLARSVRAADDVVALAAAVLALERTPSAQAVRRAARLRGVELEPVRNKKCEDARGITAQLGSGEEVCVGSRAFLMEQRISVAGAEGAASELESTGRSVLLVARAGRVVGLCALQDGLRGGARAAVQHLLDTHIEPVLMSADTRETCEALGRALDIDHLRADVHEHEAKETVERIRETGAVTAVIGHVPADDAALAAGSVSIALAAAGRARDDLGVLLAGDDPRDAALALALAQGARRRALTVVGLVLVPTLFGAVVAVLGLLPPEYAPLAHFVGLLAALRQLRG